jgi:hypothetical protein
LLHFNQWFVQEKFFSDFSLLLFLFLLLLLLLLFLLVNEKRPPWSLPLLILINLEEGKKGGNVFSDV